MNFILEFEWLRLSENLPGIYRANAFFLNDSEVPDICRNISPKNYAV
jgi:hypothetical protein